MSPLKMAEKGSRRAALLRGLLGVAILAGTLALLIGGAAAVGRLLMTSWAATFDPVDYTVALWVRRHCGGILYWPLWGTSWLGEGGPMALVTGAIVLALCRKRLFGSALTAVALFPGVAVMGKVTNELVRRQRPNWWEIHPTWDTGFPGGHVMDAVVVGGFCLSVVLPRLVRAGHRAAAVALYGGFIIATFVARINLNAHFLTDNLVGLVMGAAWLAVALPTLRWAFPRCRDC